MRIVYLGGTTHDILLANETSFSTFKKLHLKTIGMTNFSKWKYWSDRGFPYTRQQCGT